MTLTDLEENACCKSMQHTVEPEFSPGTSPVGVALRETLWQAQEQNRLKAGVVECAQLLEKDPFSVMMCVMPVAGPGDVTALIQRTLIEAFCHEYHIRLIKVDSVTKLGKVLHGRPHPSGLAQPQTAGRGSSSADVTCVLVQFPAASPGEGEEAHLSKVDVLCNKDKLNATIPLPD